MLILRLLLAVCLLASAFGIYESQLGEYDWLKKNIGVIKQSIHGKITERLFVITEDGVLASLNSQTGATLWRIVLPHSGSQFKQLSVSEQDSKVFALAHTPCENKRNGELDNCWLYEAQAYDLNSGMWLWGSHVQSYTRDSLEHADLKSDITDLAYLPSLQRVAVVARNSLVHFDATEGSERFNYKPTTLYLSKVAVSYRSDKDNKSASQYLALACIAANADAVCEKAAIVSGDVLAPASSSPTVTTFPVPSKDVHTGDLQLLLESIENGKISAEDCIFSVNNKGLSVVTLADSATKTLSFANIEACAQSGSCTTKSFVLLDKSAALKAIPAAWLCSRQDCQALGMTNISEKNPKAIQLGVWQGSAVGLGISRSMHSSSISSHLLCVASQRNSATAAVVTWDSSVEAQVAVQTVALDASYVFSSRSIQHVSLGIYAKKINTNVGGLLVVDSAGITAYHHVSQVIKAPPASPAWIRHESLARLQEAKLVSRTHNEQVAADIDFASFLSALQDQLKQTARSTVGSLQDALQNARASSGAATVAASPSSSISNRARMALQAKRFGFDKLALCVSKSKDGLVFLALDVVTEAVLWLIELPGTEAYVQSTSASLIKLVQHATGRMMLVLSNAGSGDAAAHTRLIDVQADSGFVVRDTYLEGRYALNVFSLDSGYYLLLENTLNNSEAPSMLPIVSGMSNPPAHSYVYHINRSTGVLQTYALQEPESSNMQLCSANANGEVHTTMQECEARYAFKTIPVATAVFSPSDEVIVDVAVPTAGDALNLRTVSLGDDSVLLKYINNNSVLVVTQATGSKSALYATLVDTISAKVVYRAHIEGGAAPVSATIVENNIAIFYWNVKAKRTEVSSISLYDGMIDRLGLTPFANKASAAVAAKHQDSKNISSFTNVAPLAMQKTYVMPKAVTAVHHTTTAHGIANKNLLVGVESGQVYMLDSRQLSPRRPMTEPTPAEMADALQMYTPFLQLFPNTAVTLNYAMAAGPTKITTAPSRLESSTMVLSYGHLDVHFNRVMPSADFDLLATDFNYPLLTLLLALMGGLVWYLQRKQRHRIEQDMWK